MTPSRRTSRALLLTITSVVLVLVVAVAAWAFLEDDDADPWACASDRLGLTIAETFGEGGSATARQALHEALPLIAEDAGLPESVLRDAAASFDEPGGRRATYELVTDDGVVAKVALGRLRDGTWTMGSVEQCFREP